MSDLQTELLKINTQFPISGQDNSSEGFRNNFSYIKNSLAYANLSVSELQEAQSKTISVLTHEVSDHKWPIDLSTAEFQEINLIGSTDLIVSFSGTSDEIYSLVRLQIKNKSTTDRFVNFFNETNGGRIISHISASVLLPVDGVAFFDCWSVDNGITVCVNSLGIFSEESSSAEYSIDGGEF